MKNQKPISICHVITRMIVGGAQENTLLSCLGQLRAGNNVVLVTGPSPGPEGELLKKISAPNLKVKILPDLVRPISPRHDVRAWDALRKYFKEERFDVVHTHSSKAGLVGRLAAYAANVPCIVHTVHGQAFHAYEKPWKNAIYKVSERTAALCSDRIFSVAQAMIDQCVEAKIAPRAKYQLVYSGMLIQSFEQSIRNPKLRKELKIPAHAPVIGTLARLFELKGYDDVMRAAPLVLAKHPEAHFLLVGDGILRPALEEMAKELKIEDKIHFAGLVSPDEVPQYLAQMDMLWHLSLREGLPRSVVQALATGIPAFGYQLDGTPEVILNGKTGYCLPPRDFHGVAEFTCELLDCPEKAKSMGKAGSELVHERFDAQKMSDALLEAYYEILERKNGGKHAL